MNYDPRKRQPHTLFAECGAYRHYTARLLLRLLVPVDTSVQKLMISTIDRKGEIIITPQFPMRNSATKQYPLALSPWKTPQTWLVLVFSFLSRT